jgi:hypothetical protein
MSPKPDYIRQQMRTHTDEITTSVAGPGLRVALIFDMYADDSCRVYGVPAGQKGVDGWLSLHEHFSLTLLEANKELAKLAAGRRDLLRIVPG